MPEVISIASDSGMMGGSVSHEFMLLTSVGEDSIAICTECDYRANMEAAECIIPNETNDISKDLTLVYTPNIHTIEEVCEFLHSDKKIPVRQLCTSVILMTIIFYYSFVAILRSMKPNLPIIWVMIPTFGLFIRTNVLSACIFNFQVTRKGEILVQDLTPSLVSTGKGVLGTINRKIF